MFAPGKAAGSYLVGLLNDLGYRARLHAVSLDQFFAISIPRLKIQVRSEADGAPTTPPRPVSRPPAELPVS